MRPGRNDRAGRAGVVFDVTDEARVRHAECGRGRNDAPPNVATGVRRRDN